MKTRYLNIVLAAVISVASVSCKHDQYRIRSEVPKVTVEIKRFEKDLFTVDPGKVADTSAFFIRKYGNFIRYFCSVINIGVPGDSAWAEGLAEFATDRQNNEIYGSVIVVYPDLSWLEKDISKAFSRFRYYFPGKHEPAVISCITGFNASIISADSVLGIGLDRYLGSESVYYRKLQVYQYQAARMDRDHILPDCLYGWSSTEWNYPDIGYLSENVLSDIIHEGKLYYFVRCLIPEYPEELIFGFSESQMEFCRNNEGIMWQYLVENNLLFSSDQLTRRKLTGDAPFTYYFSSESPGRAASWIGFRIVESYMQRNRSVTADSLMMITDIQSILEKARYRPPAR